MPKRIAIVSPEGERLFVDEEEAPKALAEGYHQPTEEERRLYAADESPGKAFLQGVARGVLPTADEVQVAAGDNPKNMKALKEANPWASGLGELGGFIGGSAAVPELKAEAGATGLAKLAPGFVKPLVEGGLAGLEQTVSEATLDDKPVLAEDLGKNILTSALEFGAFHGALKSLGWAGSKLLKSVKGVPVEKALEASMPDAEPGVFGADMPRHDVRQVRAVRYPTEITPTAEAEADGFTKGSPAREARAAQMGEVQPVYGEARVIAEGGDPAAGEKIQAEYDALQRKRGMGPKTVYMHAERKAAQELGYDTVEELEEAITSTRLRNGGDTVPDAAFDGTVRSKSPEGNTAIDFPASDAATTKEVKVPEFFGEMKRRPTAIDFPASDGAKTAEFEAAGTKGVDTDLGPKKTQNMRVAAAQQQAVNDVADDFLKGPATQDMRAPADVVGDSGRAATGEMPSGSPTEQMPKWADTVNQRAAGASESAPVGKSPTVENFVRPDGPVVGTPDNVPTGEMPIEPKARIELAQEMRKPKNFLGRMADLLAFRQLAMKGDLKRYGLMARWEDVIGYGKANGIVSGSSTFEKVGELASKAVKKEAGAAEGYMQAANGKFDAARAAQRIESELLRDADHIAINGDAVQYVRNILKDFVEKNKSSFSRALEEQSAWGHAIGPTDAGATIKRELFFRARGVLRDEMIQQLAEHSGPEAAVGFRQALKGLASASALKDLAERRSMGELGNRGFGMSDFFGGSLGGIVSGGNPLGAIAGAAVAHVAKDRGGFLMSAALDKLGDSRFAKNAAKGLAAILEQKLDTVPQLFGPLLPALQTAAAKGGNELLKAHLEAVKGPHGDDYLAVMGLDKGGPDGARYGLARAHVIGQMEAHADEQRAQMLKVFKNVGEHAAPAYKIYTAKQLKRDADALKTLMMSPDELSKHLPTDSDMYPETTAGAITTTQAAVQFLASKAPKDQNEGLPPAFHTRWEPSKAELDTYSQYVTAVKDPMGAAARMLKGQNVQATVETLQTVYPGTWAALQREAMNRLSEQTKPLAYRQRLALEPLLGPDVFGISPAAFKYLQTPQEPESPKGGSGSGGGGGGGDGRQKVDLQKNLETQAQRTEAR